MRFIKALILLLVALAVFGSGGYYTYVLLVKPKIELKQELDTRILTGDPTPPPDPSLPELEYCLRVKKSGDLVGAQDALAAFMEHNPHSARLGEARAALGEVNTDIFFSRIPSPDKEEYVVKPGDALAKIERKLKTNAELLTRSNNLDDPRKLHIGQVLIVSHPQFLLAINRKDKTVTLFNHGKFFKQYPVKSWNAPDAKTPSPTNVKVKEKVAWKNGARVAFGSKEYAGSSRWISMNAAGYTLYTDPAEGGVKANGIALGAEDMEELSTLLAVNLPVTIQ
jgi:LysM repeat protein